MMLALLMTGGIQAQKQKSVTDLPDISVIGNFTATRTDSATNFDVKELEFAFQQYLYPSVKADIFTALHKESSGERNFELEEAYLTFSDLIGVIMPNTKKNTGIGAIVGKKFLNVGKMNAKHPEQWEFTDRPLVLKQFLGESENLSAEGGLVMALLPLPFFSQVELGYWTASSHAEEAGEEEAHSGIEYENRLLTGRLWNSFSLSNSKEVELGLSYLLGNATADNSDDKPNVMGVDLSYTQDFSKNKMLTLRSELLQAKYAESGEAKATQSGAFLSGLYKFSPHYQAGIRMGTLGKHGDEGNVKTQWAAVLTRKLTETARVSFQYSTGSNVEDQLTVQMFFGMGPHSHVLY